MANWCEEVVDGCGDVICAPGVERLANIALVEAGAVERQPVDLQVCTVSIRSEV